MAPPDPCCGLGPAPCWAGPTPTPAAAAGAPPSITSSDSGVQAWEGSRGAAAATLQRAGSAVLLCHWQWHVNVPCDARWSRRRRLSPEMPAHTQLPRGTGVVDTLTGDGESLTWEEGSRFDKRRHPEGCTRRAHGATGAESQCELNLLSFFYDIRFAAAVALRRLSLCGDNPQSQPGFAGSY